MMDYSILRTAQLSVDTFPGNRGGATGMATMAMAIALFGVLWSIMLLPIELFALKCLHKPQSVIILLGLQIICL